MKAARTRVSAAPPCIGGIPSPTKHGVADKNRRYNPAGQAVRIETPDEQDLAVDCVARARSKSVPAKKMWNEAAFLYNAVVIGHSLKCTQSGAAVKQYRGATTDVLLEEYFAVKGRDLYARVHRVPEGGGGPKSELRVSHLAGRSPLAKSDVATLSRNKCRKEFRSRGGTCANNVSIVELKQKLEELMERQENYRAP